LTDPDGRNVVTAIFNFVWNTAKSILFKSVTKSKAVVNKVASKTTKHIDDSLNISLKRPTGKGEVGDVLSRSENIPHIGSKHPSPKLQQEIDDTIDFIVNKPNLSKTQAKRTGNGKKFKNINSDLPTQTVDGKLIEYKEYRVGNYEGTDNVHRIVVGSDGKYYYTNTHYGAPDYKGIPFYKAGKLPAKTIEKIFK